MAQAWIMVMTRWSCVNFPGRWPVVSYETTGQRPVVSFAYGQSLPTTSNLKR